MQASIVGLILVSATAPSLHAQSPSVQAIVDAFGPTQLHCRFVVPAIDTASPSNGFLGYELRYAEQGPLDASTWGNATILVPLTDPGVPAGAEASIILDFHDPIFWKSETYHLGLRYRYWDRAGPERWSDVVDTPASWDAVPPGRVNDLRVVFVATHSLRFEWTAPADDGPLEGGAADLYEFRYSALPPADADERSLAAWWIAPTTRVATGLPAPAAPGSSQQFELEPLRPGARIFAAIRAADERGNWGLISFYSSAFTLQAGESYVGVDGSPARCGAGGPGTGSLPAVGLILLGLFPHFRANVPPRTS